MKHSAKLFLLALLFFPVLASASSSKSSTKIPEAIHELFEQSFLVGSATLKFLGIKVYDISLWSEEVGFSYEKRFAIYIKYNMNFSGEDLAQRSVTEIKRLHELSKQEESSYRESLKKIFSSVRKGDEKIAFFIPSQGVIIFHNGEPAGKISDPKLSRLFVDIWLDERSSYPKITKAILGKL